MGFMANSNYNSAGCNVGLGSFLAIVFVVLKLTHQIDWAWIWVLSPLWALVIVFVIIYLIGKDFKD